MPITCPRQKTFTFFSLCFLLATIVKTLAADVTAPVTTYLQSPAAPNGKNQWYVTPVSYTLNATDLGSGVSQINYRIDGGTWQQVLFQDSLNLAPNPSFEDTDNITPLFTQYWKPTLIENGVTYSRDITNFAVGFDTSSILISSTAPGWHAINHGDAYAVTTPFSNMNASVWLKTQGVTDSASFKVYSVNQDINGVITYSLITQSPTLTGTNAWTKLSTNFTVNSPTAVGVYIEAGLQGTGNVWIDAASVSQSLTAASANLLISTDGNHTLEFYSVDRAGNSETHSCSGTIRNCLSIKIDQTPPGNWHDSGAIRGFFGSDHELWVYATVEDETSGLSTFTDKYQIHTDKDPGYGTYSNFLSCNSTWQPNTWEFLITPPFLPGVHSAYIITPKTDFCNSNWKVCKITRFYSEDMAGNVNIKDFCINGPWINFNGGGIIGSSQNINMLSEAQGDNTDGVIEAAGNTVNFFTSSKDWVVKNNPVYDVPNYSYFYGISNGTKTTINTNGNLPTASGTYVINGNYEITNSSTPNSYKTNQFSQVIFVNGNLKISGDITIQNESAALFVVKGKVEIGKAVNTVGVGIIADGDFYTAYDRVEGDGMGQLLLRGVFAANKFYFQRTLQGTQNDVSPSEDFTYEPKYVTKIRDYIGTNSVRWLGETNN